MKGLLRIVSGTNLVQPTEGGSTEGRQTAWKQWPGSWTLKPGAGKGAGREDEVSFQGATKQVPQSP